MAKDEAYRRAEELIEEARLTGATGLDLRDMRLTELPESLGNLTQLREVSLSNNELGKLPEGFANLTHLHTIYLSNNQLRELPNWIGSLTQLVTLYLYNNQLHHMPDGLGRLTQLRELNLAYNQLHELPDELANLTQLQRLYLSNNQLHKLPDGLGNLNRLQRLNLDNNRLRELPDELASLTDLRELSLANNPLHPELDAAYRQGDGALRAYLRAQGAEKITLNEAKLILVGEGAVGKSSLLGALRDDPWEENRPTTHGIEIKPVLVNTIDNRREISLNGWDFGGQPIYRPTHQLFFSAPAVYLVVWKPREGPQQGFVKEWIRLIKHRASEAKILVVATHASPFQRQPDIDRQELWDLFGKDTVLDFFHVDSKPDHEGNRNGIDELKQAIARVAARLPEVGRKVPKRWQQVRAVLAENDGAYLPFDDVMEICREHGMEEDEGKLFIRISHQLGHLIHYEHDPTLRDIVVLKPDWLATAISFVLDDPDTRAANGLVRYSRLCHLWNDSKRTEEFRYPSRVHPILSRLMERFDLSYRVAELSRSDGDDPANLVAQLVPETCLDVSTQWPEACNNGDSQQQQICRIVDDKGQSATAEGLFYQLIVRLHKYSLGRDNYTASVHWQRGLILDDGYNGRALLEHVGNDIRITVCAAYPERFLAMLTGEVKFLVESFWEGLRCEVMVPCIEPCGREVPGTGLYGVRALIESKREGYPKFPCPTCTRWQSIDELLRNAPAVRPGSVENLISSQQILAEVRSLRELSIVQQVETIGRFDHIDVNLREVLSKVDQTYANLLQVFTDEAKEGPRLFTLVPVERNHFNPRNWTSALFRLTLWCEHSRQPLPLLNAGSTDGVYDIEFTRAEFKKFAPYLKFVMGMLSLVLPVAFTNFKLDLPLHLPETAYKAFEYELDFGKEVVESSLEGAEKFTDWLGGKDESLGALHMGEGIRAHGAILRDLHAMLKERDPGFGGLVRVLNKRNEFLWVHPQFEGEY